MGLMLNFKRNAQWSIRKSHSSHLSKKARCEFHSKAPTMMYFQLSIMARIEYVCSAAVVINFSSKEKYHIGLEFRIGLGYTYYDNISG